MSIHVALHHVTSYCYDRLIALGPQVIRLRPAPHCRSRILSYALRVEPETHFLNWQQDPFANYLARVVIPEKTKSFRVVVDLVAEMAVFNPFDFFLEPSAEKFPFCYSSELKAELAPYLTVQPMGPQLSTFFKNVPRRERRSIDFLVELNSRIHRKVRYTVRMEPGVQTPEQTLALGSGSCRDSGWLLVQLLRNFGLAARFVSGYLIQLKPDVEAIDGPTGASKDFTDLHAWCEVYLPGAGWVGLDPTSGLLAGEGHIPIACTPEPSSAAPISGALDECEVAFMHQMSAQRVYESPRVTKPYEEAQWESINALGARVDEELDRQDVRLTMGGEPTFVSALDRDGSEWNTEALGPTKRGLGLALMHRLGQEYGAGGFLHYGQGKWYPGEQLPRWTLSAYWRSDGVPCWRRPELFADEREPHHYTTSDAHAFLHVVADRLGVGRQHIQPGFEDTFYYLWRERTLPVNVDPFDARLADEMERARLRRVYQHGLDVPIGYALPLACRDSAGEGVQSGALRWQSGPWHLRDERLYLIPGDSPMGFRLPLESLPWTNAMDLSHPIDRDPFAHREPLRPLSQSVPISPQQRESLTGSDHAAPNKFESRAGLIRTALCVEVRNPNRNNGPKLEFAEPESAVLYVFMPPLTRLEDYLGLLQIIEETAYQLDVSIVLEGYPPPRDARLTMLQAPRVDEARNDQVYELEIALKEIDIQMSRPEGCSPWMIDRALRNILIDVTGNTHRAEFSIDKLYSPDGPTGRLGLLELRGFEMPPHALMSLVQQLLIRALVAWFWKRPYRPPGRARLTRWGTQLHDRFMLPTFILLDFQDVLSELQAAGFFFDMKWFAPHAEFRFPLIGETDLREVRLSLRAALEPWHVMGEESGAGGTVRYVDASVERLELKVSGYVDNRYSIAINGIVPRLQPTGVEGEYVIGIRYRAWSPPSALHPTIGVHAPLTFDLVDNWLSRSMGGCRYYVSHPGGRSYDTFPVNSFEAESRRLARFSRLDHTPGVVSPMSVAIETEFPYTLDLRRHH